MTSSIQYDPKVTMEMRDGTLMAGEVYRPDDGGKHPAIILRTPYHGDEVINFSYARLLPSIKAGYAVVVAYQRGRFGSGGTYNLAAPQQIEGGDCYDTVEWVASQRWCDGNIGMAGESALGTVQWRTARENPPHLKAIAPSLTGAPGESTPEITDAPVLLNIAVSLLINLAGDTLNRMEQSGTDVTEMRRQIKMIEDDPSIAYNYLPLKDLPQFNIPGTKDMWQTMLRLNQSKQPAVKPEPYPYHKVNVPCLNVSSWYDPWNRHTFHTFHTMKLQGGNFARQHQYLFAGPWCHHKPTRVLGNIDFGPLASEPGSRAWEYQLSYFDKYLKGKDISLPAVRYFTMGRNTWQDAADWPLAKTDWQRFFLHSRGGANSCTGDGVLGCAEPLQEPPDTYVYNPLHPVYTTGGKGGEAENGFITGPVDQVHLERRADVLCYTTPELEKDTEVTGPLELHLFASSSCVDTDFTAKLVDVYPDGPAYNIADGITRAQYRNSLYKPDLLKPGEIVEFIIRLGHTSQLFRRGHRIRIDIASSHFPTFDRNMNTGNPVGVDAEGIQALQTIYHQTGYASYLDFPVIPVK